MIIKITKVSASPVNVAKCKSNNQYSLLYKVNARMEDDKCSTPFSGNIPARSSKEAKKAFKQIIDDLAVPETEELNSDIARKYYFTICDKVEEYFDTCKGFDTKEEAERYWMYSGTDRSSALKKAMTRNILDILQ